MHRSFTVLCEQYSKVIKLFSIVYQKMIKIRGDFSLPIMKILRLLNMRLFDTKF